MFRHVKVYGFVVFVGILVSCATSSIETNKDPANLKALEKVFVLVNTGDVKVLYSGSKETPDIKDTSLGGYLLYGFEKQLTQWAIENQGIRVGGLELGNESIQKSIEDFGAPTILTVELVDGTVTTTNFLYSGSILVSIVDVSLNKTVWRAKLRVQALTGWGVPISTIDDLVKKAFDQMGSDGLLKPSKNLPRT